MIKISSAKSVKGKNQYTNELIEWADLRERFRKPKLTGETMEEYINWATEKNSEGKNTGKSKQLRAKDAAGAFVGGWLEVDGEQAGLDRNLENIVSRTILNFDFDNVDNVEQIEQLQEDLYTAGTQFILYSTHSHTPNKPRVRVLLPLDREVNKVEFEAISRLIVGSSKLWASMIDTKSFKPAQAMFYATTAKDAEYIFDYQEGKPVNVDEMLAVHRKDCIEAYDGGKWWEYPKVPSEQPKPDNRRISTNTTLQDPTKKPSYIGAFNRAYNVHEAIEKFIPDKYSHEGNNRYTWEEGTAAAGVEVHSDFTEADHLTSFHESDPASAYGTLNAFDLIRIHLFNHLDINTPDDVPMNERLSYQHMISLAQTDMKVTEQLLTAGYQMNLNEQQIAKDTPKIYEVAARKEIDELDFKKDTLSSLSKQYQEHLTEDEEKQLYLNGNASADIDEFMKDLGEYKDPIETGFPIFDRVLDGGLHDGLYIIGAISSLGKTTFVLQLADQIVKAGQDVLFFSLEMSSKEIKAKSVSRLTFENVLIDGKPEHNAKTVRGITDLRSRQNGHTDIYGKEHPAYTDYEKQVINRSIKQYADEAKNLYIYESIGDISVEDIRNTVEKHKKHTGNTPVVIIDYLQILKGADDKKTDKQNTDVAVKALKHISRDYLTPVFAISSLNRANYTSSISMSAFKESGAIEYSSDVLIGLQFSNQREVDKHNKNKKQNEPVKILDHDEEKSKPVRKIELKILKNRNGIPSISVDFDYHAEYNSFKETKLVSKYKPKYEGKLFEENELPTV